MYDTSNSKVRPEKMTDEVWDFIFCDGPKPKSCAEDEAIIDEMKKEFQCWYPFDLRVSRKDLIQNHLTFCIYNHAAIMAKNHWSRGFRCNGHLMLDAEKMSKAKGNFKTLAEAIKEFSAYATRFSLADAGDGVENANFDPKTANATILLLAKEMDWMKEVMKQDLEHRLRTGPTSTFADKVFASEINIAVNRTEKNYQDYMFREALMTGVYHLQSARDEYKLSCSTLEGMNRGLVWCYMVVQTRLITPICPHYAEHVRRNILKKEGFVVKGGWPVADAPDITLKSGNKYLQESIVSIRKAFHKQIDTEKVIQEALPTICVGELKDLKEMLKECMPFIKFKRVQAVDLGAQALEFGETEFLRDNLDWIKRQVGVEDVQVLSASNPDDRALAGSHAERIQRNPPFPGNPTAIFI